MKKNLNGRFLLSKEKWLKSYWLMRNFIILFFALNLSVMANGLSQEISMAYYENASLVEVFEDLKVQTGFGVLYKESEIDPDLRVSMIEENSTIQDVLDLVLEGTKLTYRIQDDVIVIYKAKEMVLPLNETKQENKEVQGTVKDEDGNTLPGVSILVKGTAIGTATDIDGNYLLEIPADAKILVFSFIGMQSQEIAYSGQLVQNVVLSSDAEQMAEVVVTGYQTIAKERATGAFTSIKQEAIETKLNSSLINVIEGMTTGMVKDSKGNITIRGASTFEAEASPLIVVDGFTYDGDLNSINADNIENITILKDGVAASIYGSRSANGVIVITTRKGKKGEFKVSYKGTFSTTQKTDMRDLNRSSTSDYIDGQIAQYDSAPFYYSLGYGRIPEVDYLLLQSSHGTITREEAMLQIDKLRGNNIYKEVEKHGLRNAFTQQHNLNISGGGEKNLFNASVNYLDEKGEQILSKSKRFVFDVKNVWKPKDYITFSTSANIVYTKSKGSKTDLFNLTSSGFGDLQPYNRIVDENGHPVDDTGFFVSPLSKDVYDGRAGMKSVKYSALDDMREGMNESNDIQTRLSAQLNLELIKGLSLNLGGAWSRGNLNTKGHYSAESFVARKGYNDGSSLTDPTKHYVPEGGILDETRSINESYTYRAQLNFDRSFDDGKHRVTAIAGHEVRRDQFDNATLPTKFGYNPVSGDFEYIDIPKLDSWSGEYSADYLLGRYSSIPEATVGKLSYRDNRFVSWYGNGSYEFDNRFLVSGSIRLDLTNFFGTDPKYRYKPTWSTGATYKLSNEDWFSIDFIDRLYVRGSYGINGNISMTEGPFMILRSNGYSQDAQGVAYAIQSPANNQLRWEKTETTNIGVDLAMFNNRVNLSIDAYKKHSTDLLAPDAVDATTGIRSLSKNAGEITNKGLEISLNADVVRNENFRFNTILNASYNKSHVDEYNVNRAYSSYYLTDSGINEKGYPVKSLWGFRGAPLTDAGDVQAYNKGGDLIHPNSVTKDDMIYLGSEIPKVNLAWTNTFSYKNFEASFMFVGSFGAKMRNNPFTGSNIGNKHIAKAWKKPGDELNTIYPKISKWGAGWWYNTADYFVKDADYVKLRELTIAYNIPKKLLDKVGLSKARLFLQGRNLWTIQAKGLDMDPEASHTPTKLWGGYYEIVPEVARLPLKSEFYLGVSFEF